MPKRRPVIKTIIKSLRFSEDQWREIEKSLTDSGLNFSQYAIKRLLNFHIKPGVDKKVLYELSRIGNNLNQIARKLNGGSPFDAAAMLEIDAMAEELHNACKAIS